MKDTDSVCRQETQLRNRLQEIDEQLALSRSEQRSRFVFAHWKERQLRNRRIAGGFLGAILGVSASVLTNPLFSPAGALVGGMLGWAACKAIEGVKKELGVARTLRELSATRAKLEKELAALQEDT